MLHNRNRGGSRAARTSKMECFVIIVNRFQPLTIITKHSILNVGAALDPPPRKESLGYGTCSKYLAYSIESQAGGFRMQASVMKSFYRKAVGFRF